MIKRFLPIVLFLALAGSAHAQSFNTFSMTAQPITLPNNQITAVGTIAGMTFSPTKNFDLREDNIIVPAGNVQAFLGGFNYRLPVLQTKLNNVSPTLNGYRFQFYITASVGVDRITGPIVAQHYAFLAGGGINYDLTGSGRWTMGVEVRYAKLPGYANNTTLVSVGPAFHF